MRYLYLAFLIIFINACIVVEDSSPKTKEELSLIAEATMESQMEGEVGKGTISEMVAEVKKGVLRIESGTGLQISTGTGFVISDDGLVLTANHVISNPNQITAKLIDSEDLVFDGELLFSDEQSDIAIIQINARKLKVLEIVPDGFAAPGVDVYSLGFPLGIDSDVSVSKGIVSRIMKIDDFSLIEHDSKIMSGNSGGPLINSNGQVLGLNIAVLPDFETATGLNYAVPSKSLNKAISEIAVSIEGKIVAVPTATPMPAATPTPYPTWTPTPRKPIPTSTPTPEMLSSPLSVACEIDKTPIFKWFTNDKGIDATDLTLENIKNYEESILASEGKLGGSTIFTILPNFVLSAQFLSLDEISYGFTFRKDVKNPYILNGNQSFPFDAFIVSKNTSINNTWKWQHFVRNERTKEFISDYTEAASGVLYNVNKGPRGWNELALMVDDDRASIFFNREFVTTLILDFPKEFTEYRSKFVSHYFGGEDKNLPVLIRAPELGCPIPGMLELR